MAIPVLAGIPWLAGAIASFFVSLIGFFGKYLTRRLAIVGAAIVVIVGLTAAFFAAMSALTAGIMVSMPPFVAAFIGHFVPDNTDVCVSAVLAALALRWAYDWHVRVIQMKAQA